MSALQFAALLMFLLLGTLNPVVVHAQVLIPGNYYWYVPEHERFSGTVLYSKPQFDTGTVRILSTQRFRFTSTRRGWALLEFDIAGKAFIHLRVLNTMMYDSAASDLSYEFQRASVFPEEPEKIEARLKGQAVKPTPAITESKTPAWKRYKDSWGIKPGRPAPVASEEGTSATLPARPVTTSPTSKTRSKYPLLTPLGSEQPQEPAPTDASGQDAETSSPSR